MSNPESPVIACGPNCPNPEVLAALAQGLSVLADYAEQEADTSWQRALDIERQPLGTEFHPGLVAEANQIKQEVADLSAKTEVVLQDFVATVRTSIADASQINCTSQICGSCPRVQRLAQDIPKARKIVATIPDMPGAFYE